MTPGQRVRAVRESMNRSSHDLAASAGMRERFLLDIEDGLIERVHTFTYQKLADHLGVTVGYILGDEELPVGRQLEDEVPEGYRWLVKWTMRLVVAFGVLNLIVGAITAGSALIWLAVRYLQAPV